MRLIDADKPLSRLRLVAAVLTGRLGKSRVYEQRLVGTLPVRTRQGALRIARDGEVGEGPGEELPGFVAMLPQHGEVIRRGARDRGKRLGLGPAGGGDDASAGDERELPATACGVEDGKGLAAEDVGMAGEFEQGDSAVEVRRRRLVRRCG